VVFVCSHSLNFTGVCLLTTRWLLLLPCVPGVQQWQLQVPAVRAVHAAAALWTLLLWSTRHQPMPTMPCGGLQQPGEDGAAAAHDI
jgi:hypothetical protein